ncbi:hypothetical protein BJ508DRAFT_364497 [Ascobolus immersus RN42]|uniref:Mediator of RNA polymerase II transcription subunit 6 n=1 Tax=Ascobolus immersus RN42 TaxID=1160509 RepID=A0A3N4HUB0_ASCIM|nr:hypothetical protein BJ508DRAFT_364497 [Ascobolus immersus RN42]
MQNQVDPDTLDEIYWRGQPFIDMYGGQLNMNTVLHYFHHSPFSIATSNNSQLFTQFQFNLELKHLMWDRTAFEKRLLMLRGEEFRVIYPPPMPDLPPNPTPIQIQQHQQQIQQLQASIKPNFFIIRRQTRYSPNISDVKVKADYYIVNGNVYQAPLVEKVIGNRALAVSRALRDTEKIVRDLREFKDSQATQPASATTTAQSTQVTTAPSTQQATQQATQQSATSQASVALRTQKKAIEKQNKETFLSFALNAAQRFSEDYLDSTDAPHKPKDTLAAAQAQQKALDAGKKKEEESKPTTRDGTPAAGGSQPTNQPSQPVPPQMPKKKRTKSKANINVNGDGSQTQPKATVTVGR